MLQDLREPIHLENHLLFACAINPAA